MKEKEEPLNVTGTNNEKVEYNIDKEYLDRLEKYAEENGFVINKFAKKKIEWMRTHSIVYSVCFCDPINRTKCPCDHVHEDMKRFNGRCLCRLLWKPEAYAKWIEQKKKQKPLTTYQKETMNDFEKKEAKKQIKDMWKNLEK